MPLNYPGDRTGHYDHSRGSGLVGKVIGPTHKGEYLLVVDAYHDVDRDITYVTTQALLGPAAALARMQEAAES